MEWAHICDVIEEQSDRCWHKKLPNFSKSCTKGNHSSLTLKMLLFHFSPRIHHAFGLLFIETMSPRTFKNRPIWSHCRGVAFFSSCPGFDSCPYHKKILLLGSYFGTNVKNKIVENRRIRETPFQIFDYDHSVLLSRPS